ncbi:MAG: alpha/beta hydrolase, partial [Microthrixaceae bacterium]
STAPTSTAPTSTAPTSTAPTSTAAGTVPSGFPADWQAPPLEWRDCATDETAGESADLQCATLAVPLDWSRPDGPTIELALGRIPARGSSKGTVVTNPGGPGGSGLDFLSGEPVSPALSERYDTVSWDPRGVGSSTAVTCSDGVGPYLQLDSDPDTPDEQAALDAAARKVSAACGTADGPLLPHVGTAEVARDLEAIRRALGQGPLNYIGFSYGTQIGQQYAARFPDQIRTMVLDGVVDPSLGYTEFLLGQARAFEAAFDANDQGCRNAGRRRCGVDDLGAAYDRVKASAEAAPIPAGRARLTPSEVAVAATYVAYLDDGWQELGPALAAAEKGDGSDLLDLANSYYDFGGFSAYAAVTCTDTPPPRGEEAYRAFADEMRRAAPRFGGSVANELLVCASWPALPTDVPAPVVATGAPPIVVVGNTGDPATPYSNAVAVADRLASGVLVTAERGGHTAYGVDECVTSIVDRYVIDLEVPPDGTVCR